MGDSHECVVATAILEVHDLDAAARFYQRIGLSVEVFDADYAFVTHHNHELLHLARTDMPRRGSVYLNVADADAWHSRCVDAGEPPTLIEDRAWGMREFSITDPSGNSLRIGTNL